MSKISEWSDAMATPHALLACKLLEKGFSDIEIGLFLQDVTRTLKANPDGSMSKLRNSLFALGWYQVEKDTTVIRLVRDHLSPQCSLSNVSAPSKERGATRREASVLS